ncbi:MAG: hypothetical protein C3F11_05925 [Methylocystaceae bacterium]|nr:MAG: hypothetical protein C3F11_05925 [Methylocystaceae bacterium]
MTHQECDGHNLLACPVDGLELNEAGEGLKCEKGHSYPIVQGVPVLLRGDVEETIGLAARSLSLAYDWARGVRKDPFFIETLGISDQQKEQVRSVYASGESRIDPVISFLVGATNGILYKNVIGQLDRIPLPELRLPLGEGRRILDVGCSWGRWSMAAAAKGYQPVGIDPSLGAVLAAKRLATTLGLPFEGVVADARYLPFKRNVVDAAFSYSVLQHFSKPDARQAFEEIARVTRPGGTMKIQMASSIGVRSFQHIVRRRFREPMKFEVRYWTPWELLDAFRDAFGNAELEVDCYFGLGLQSSDIELYSPPMRSLVKLSELLRRTSTIVRPLAYMADSIYLTARNSPQHFE